MKFKATFIGQARNIVPATKEYSHFELRFTSQTKPKMKDVKRQILVQYKNISMLQITELEQFEPMGIKDWKVADDIDKC